MFIFFVFVGAMESVVQEHNKRFNRDRQRWAFLVQMNILGYGYSD